MNLISKSISSTIFSKETNKNQSIHTFPYNTIHAKEEACFKC